MTLCFTVAAVTDVSCSCDAAKVRAAEFRKFLKKKGTVKIPDEEQVAKKKK